MERILSRDADFISLVHRYATPFAIWLVVIGLWASQPVGRVRDVSIAILLLGILLNIGVIAFIARTPDMDAGLRKAVLNGRMLGNLGMNTALVWFLGGHWPPVWLLLALTPLASAIYGPRAKAFALSAVVAGILLAIDAARGFNSPADWCATATNGLFVVLMSLMINELAERLRALQPA